MVVVADLVAEALQEAGKMKTRAQKFLTPAEQDKITATVREMELRTSGEIVPMVVSSCDDYPTAAITAGTLISLPTAILLTHLLGGYFWISPQNLWLFLALFAFLYFIIFHAAMRIDKLKYPFLPRKRVDREVSEAALGAFYAEGLFQTRDANGILLFISVFEKRVTILADKGINEKLDPKTWDQIVDELTLAIRRGDRCKGICDAVRNIGEILEAHFPFQKDDEDELHNLIVR